MSEQFSLEELQKKAAAFIRSLTSGTAATVVALAGDLGAGKTTFTKAAAKALGVEESVTSPTFVLMKRYDLVDQKFARLIHIDAYRMKDASELRALGWNNLIQDPQNLILIEWPERVESAIPNAAHRVSLTAIAPDSRQVRIT